MRRPLRLLPLQYEGEDGGEDDDDDDGVIDLIIVNGCGEDEMILLTMIIGKALSWLIRSNISMHR